MKRVLLSLASLATMAAALAVPAAAHADVSLGANFGAAIVVPRVSQERVAFGWPYSSLQTLPGIRVGFTNDVGRHEVYLDSTFWAQGSPSARVLLLLVGDRNRDIVTMMLGGGVGFRQRIAGGHGTFREELRADFVVERREMIEQKIIVGLKLGFDLWFR